MSYCIKRTYNRHGDHDYLVARDPENVTVCAGYLARPMIEYPSIEAAEGDLAEINEAYHAKFPGTGHKFQVAPFPPSN